MNQDIPNQPVVPAAWMEDEIDLREYIEVLVKYWKWIVAAGVLAAVIAFVVSSFLPRTYEASASVIILKSKTEVSFDPKIQTTTEDQLTQKGYQDTLVGLVKAGSIAETVLENQRDILPADVKNAADLLKKVDASSTGDIISITVSDVDPTRAAQLADAWADVYINYVNQLYGNQTAPLLAEVETQAGEAEQSYKSAQAALENFLKENRIPALQREISVRQDQVKRLLNDQYVFLVDVSVRVRQDHVKKLLNDKYNALTQIDSWLDDAKSIRLHVASGGGEGNGGAGDAMAFFMLQRKALADSADVGYQLQLQVSPMDFSGMEISVGDVDKLIDTLQQRRTEISQDIQLLEKALPGTVAPASASSVDTGLNSYIAALDAEVATLQSELEAQSAQKRELQQTRDLAWDNLTTLRRKQAELRLSGQISDSQVRLAAGALIPDKPVSPKRLLNTAVAGALAIMLAVFAVFAIEYWREGDNPAEPEPGLKPQ